MTQTTLAAAQKSNSLVFKTNKVVGKEHIYISIRLDDECKNGHHDFAITGDIYEAGKPKIDRYHISGGCIHDDILKHFPQFEMFVKLHLCDYEGVPMYAVENGFYHLTEGFNTTKPGDKAFKTEYCKYYRITPEQFDIISLSKNKIQFALNLDKLGILAQWKREANMAIEFLEKLTGTKFLIDSVKTQYHAPTPEQIKEEQDRINNGYYTPEAEAAREKAKQDQILSKLMAERDKEINKANTEFEVKKQVLLIGGSKALDNCIFYNHSNTLAFNWRGYNNLSNDFISSIIEKLQLPEGVKIENKKA